MSPLRVTLADLRALEACDRDVKKFCTLFGEQVDITVETVTAALAAGIDVDWWARQLFGDEYERVRAAAWAEYERAMAAAIVALADARSAQGAA